VKPRRIHLRVAWLKFVAAATLLVFAGCGGGSAEKQQQVTITPQGVGGLRLGASVSALRERGLIGPMRPGCELVSGQRVAELSPPLHGLAIFYDPNTKLSSVHLQRGVETARGIGIGALDKKVLSAYPEADYRPPDPQAPIPIGLITVDDQEGELTFEIDALTYRVSQIDAPGPSFCE
jgi:hypothetical protein